MSPLTNTCRNVMEELAFIEWKRLSVILLRQIPLLCMLNPVTIIPIPIFAGEEGSFPFLFRNANQPTIIGVSRTINIGS